ncbi:glycosyltransferase [Pullulanibacillus pueri]|nr:glycosyltransferase [Pullulanibacillus pueri]
MRVKILVLSNMYPSVKALSFGIFVKNQVEALKKRNLDVDVIAIDDARMGLRFALPKYSKWLLKNIMRMLKAGTSYHIIHAHYIFPTGMVGLWYKKLFKAKLIVTAHGGDIDRMARKSQRLFTYTRKVLEHADHIIAVGEQLKEDIVRDFSIEPCKVSVLNMGVNRELFYPIDQKLAVRRLGLNPSKKHILFVGNIIKDKGLRELFSAFQILSASDRELELHLIGHHKEPVFYEELAVQASQMGSDRIHFYPVQSQAQLACWMSACDLFVLPSYMEGFGLVALEAMSCGTPVVATAVGGLKYLIGEENGLLVPPKNSEALAEAMAHVLNDSEVYTNLVKNGLKLAECYSEHKLIDSLINLYKQTRSETMNHDD